MILELEYGSFINDYGVEERFVKKEIDSYLSGHIFRGSSYESDDDCGTCDGARCAWCMEHYIVTVFDRPTSHPDGYMVTNVSFKQTFTNVRDATICYNLH